MITVQKKHMNPTKHDLPLDARIKVCAILNQALVDTIDLSMQAKQAHWNVKGTTFQQLHELFDQVYETMAPHTDTIAERIAQLGGLVQGTVQAVHNETTLKAYPVEMTKGEDHVNAVADALAKVGATLRKGILEIDEFDDPTSADVLTEVSRDVDKYLWFVEAHLQND